MPIIGQKLQTAVDTAHGKVHSLSHRKLSERRVIQAELHSGDAIDGSIAGAGQVRERGDSEGRRWRIDPRGVGRLPARGPHSPAPERAPFASRLPANLWLGAVSNLKRN